MPDEQYVPDEQLLDDGSGDAPSGADLESWFDDDVEDAPVAGEEESYEEEVHDEDETEEGADEEDEEVDETDSGEEGEEESEDEEEEAEEDAEDDEPDFDNMSEEELDAWLEANSDEEEDEEEEETTSLSDTSLKDLTETLGAELIAENKEEQKPVDAEKAQQEARKAYLNGLKFDSVEDLSDEMLAIQLPDSTIKVGEEDVNLAEFEKEYPKAVAVTKALALHTANKIVGDKVQRLDAMIAREEFFNELSYYHPDIRRISRSSEFAEWKNQASPQVIAMLKDSDIDNVALAVNLFKQQTAPEESKPQPKKKKASTAQKKKAVKFAKKKNLLSGNVTGKKKSSKKTGYDKYDQSEAAADSWFDEEAD